MAKAKFPVNADPRTSPHWRKRTDFKSVKAWQAYTKFTWSRWNEARENRHLPRVDPPPRLNINVTQRPRAGHTSDSISFNRFRNSEAYVGDVDYSDGSDEDEVVEIVDAGPLLNTFGDPELKYVLEHGLLDNLKFDQGGVSSAGETSISSSTQAPATTETMPTQNKRPPSDDAGPSGVKRANTRSGGTTTAAPTTTAASADAGHNSSSDGGFDSAQGPISYLSHGGYRIDNGSMKFVKVHRIKSWAIPYWNVSQPTYKGGSNLITTPLTEIPWQYAYFYLSPEEFELLPAGSYIRSVHLKVLQTVATTGYPTGGTTASVATTNHPKVLVIGKDLERKCRGGNSFQLTLDAGSIPTAANDVDRQDFIDKAYGTDQTAADASVVVAGCAHKIPYYNKNHFCIYQPNATQALARGFDAANAPGQEYFQNMVTEVNSNDVTWDYVDEMHYEFSSAPIGEQFRPIEIDTTSSMSQAVGSAQYYNAIRTLNNTNAGADFTITETLRPSNYNSIPIVTYSSSVMEKGACMVRGDAANQPARQPSYHLGMRAIDKSSPESPTTRASEFVLANIEFEIEATMIVSLPSYPNRFVKPKYYNTSFENAAAGIGRYPEANSTVTFNLPVLQNAAPPVAAVDAVGDVPTESNMASIRILTRPTRSLPSVPTKRKRKPRKEE